MTATELAADPAGLSREELDRLVGRRAPRPARGARHAPAAAGRRRPGGPAGRSGGRARRGRTGGDRHRDGSRLRRGGARHRRHRIGRRARPAPATPAAARAAEPPEADAEPATPTRNARTRKPNPPPEPATPEPATPEPATPEPATPDRNARATPEPARPNPHARRGRRLRRPGRDRLAAGGSRPGAAAAADAGRLVIRTLRPEASSVSAVLGDRRVELDRVHPGGVFAGAGPRPAAGLPARGELRRRRGGRAYLVDDPYRWLPTLGEIDLHLIGEGRHERLWDALGAHVRTYETPHGPVTGHLVRGLGAQRPRRAGDRRLRLLAGAGRTRCARSAPAASGRSSCPGVGAGARSTSSASSARTASGGTRPTRWRSPPRCRRPPRRWCTASTHDWDDEEWLAKRAVDPLALPRR